MSLELLGAGPAPATQQQPPSTWWKWALGLTAACGLGYLLIQDLPAGSMMPRHVPPGRRPW